MRSWRFLTWAILVVQAFFFLWMTYAVFSTSDDCAGLSGDLADACKAAATIGLGIGFVFILFVWSLVDIILGVIWLVTNNWMVSERKADGQGITRNVPGRLDKTAVPIDHPKPRPAINPTVREHVVRPPKEDTREWLDRVKRESEKGK